MPGEITVVRIFKQADGHINFQSMASDLDIPQLKETIATLDLVKSDLIKRIPLSNLDDDQVNKIRGLLD